MASCEKCWYDAQGNADVYHQMIFDRRHNPCTPEQQAGESATECIKCERMTIHQHIKSCIVCGFKPITK